MRLVLFLFGFTSGFTIMLSGNNINFWLSDLKFSKVIIGYFSITSIAYSINFIWSPLIDKVSIPILSSLPLQARWLVMSQLLLVLSIFCTAFVDPLGSILIFGLCVSSMSFFSATQDIAINSIRASISTVSNVGSFSAIYIVGYRLGNILANSGGILLSAYTNFNVVYVISGIMVAAILLFNFFVLRAINLPYKVESPKFSFSISLSLLKILLFLAIYRLGDNFLSVMINPFFIDMGFDAKRIAYAGKFFGITTSILGGLYAGKIMKSISVMQSLYRFGLLHLFAHAFFLVQYYFKDNLLILLVTVGIESFTGGMVMTAYIAYITLLSQGQYQATKYSLFSSMMGLSRSVFPMFSGVIVESYGWVYFFLCVLLLSIPGVLAAFLKQKFE